MKFLAKISLAVSLVLSLLLGERPTGKYPSLLKSYVDTTGFFDGNRIHCDMENNGLIVGDYYGRAGLEWPKGNRTFVVYTSAIWFGGKVNGEVRVVYGDYSPELVPGPLGSDPAAPEHKLYKVDRTDLSNPLANEDFQNWPVELGAPWVDEDDDGVYTPLPAGLDHPDYIGDQVIWYVANDSGTGSHGIWHSKPMGLEMQFTTLGFDRSNVLGDIMFVKVLTINKGENRIDSAYVGFWADPDLGDAGDDYVGCDTTLNMGICYNDGWDFYFANYSGGTPAVGYDILQGPIVPSPGDTAYAFGTKIPDFKNLPMTAFSQQEYWTYKYEPNSAIEVYYNLKGLNNEGGITIDPVTNLPTTFLYPGDPLLDTGRDDDQWVDSDILSSGDRRFLISSGPFTMAPGDSQEVVLAIIVASDKAGPLQSYKKLKEVDQIAQRFYDGGLIVVADPPQPELEATTYPEAIILKWDDRADLYNQVDHINLVPVPVVFDSVFVTGIKDSIIVVADTIISEQGDTTIDTWQDTLFSYVQILDHVDTLYEGQPTHYRFEGYNIYQLESSYGKGKKTRVATFDLINDVTKVVDKIFDPDLGLYVEQIQPGNDSGIQHYIKIDQDALNQFSPLKVNREYYFAVAAYAYNPFGIPKVIESPLNVIAIRPEIPNTWVGNDSIMYGSQYKFTHSAGSSDGFVTATVVDPMALTGHEYKVEFFMQHYYLDEDGKWKFTNYPDLVGRGRSKDCSASELMAAALVSRIVGTVDILLDFTMDCGGNFVDGVKIDLPDDLTINSWESLGDCSYASYGQNCVNNDGTLDVTTNTITWGDSARSEFGSIEQGHIWKINVQPPVNYPFDVAYEVYDDGYDGTIVDANGTVTVTELGFEFKTLKEWRLSDRTIDSVLFDHQRLMNGTLLDHIIDGVYYSEPVIYGEIGNPVVDGLLIAVSDAPGDLKWVGVTANADGILPLPVDALAWWHFPDYLIAGGDYTNQQVTTDATWIFNIGPQYGVDQDAMMNSMFMYSGGFGSAKQGIDALIPDDFEVRFTGSGKAINYWGDGSVVDVPFEWWNVGDPNDPSDDFQLIPYLLDEDDNGQWNLQFGSESADHGTSGGRNDPWTDRVYVLTPVDDAPGTQGYDNFMAAYGGGADLPPWYAAPGDNDAGGPMDAWNAFSRTVFMIWNGGDVVAATSPADYKAESPEIGTVFHIATLKPITAEDRFVFNKKLNEGTIKAYEVGNIKVWPNPYFGYNPEERSPTDQQMHFIRLPETGKCTIRIFDLAGNVVRILHHDDAGRQDMVWDLRNTAGRPVASGMYLAHIQTDQGTTLLKLAVIQPER